MKKLMVMITIPVKSDPRDTEQFHADVLEVLEEIMDNGELETFISFDEEDAVDEEDGYDD